MRTTCDVFHLAIPVHDLDAAQHFYVTMLGCKLARRYPDRITLDFFGDQLVCHLTEYRCSRGETSRAFTRGTSASRSATRPISRRCITARSCARSRSFLMSRPGSRAMAEEHRTFVLLDPSGNLLEFKHYRDPRMMY